MIEGMNKDESSLENSELENSIEKENNKDYGWTKSDDTTYKYYVSGAGITFTYDKTTTGSFDCNASDATTGTNCKYLTR